MWELIGLLILVALAFWVVDMLSERIPPFIVKVIYVIMVVVVVFYLLSFFGLAPANLRLRQ